MLSLMAREQLAHKDTPPRAVHGSNEQFSRTRRRDGAGGQQELRWPFVCCSAPVKRVLLDRFPSPACRSAAKLPPQDG